MTDLLAVLKYTVQLLNQYLIYSSVKMHCSALSACITWKPTFDLLPVVKLFPKGVLYP